MPSQGVRASALHAKHIVEAVSAMSTARATVDAPKHCGWEERIALSRLLEVHWKTTLTSFCGRDPVAFQLPLVVPSTHVSTTGAW